MNYTIHQFVIMNKEANSIELTIMISAGTSSSGAGTYGRSSSSTVGSPSEEFSLDLEFSGSFCTSYVYWNSLVFCLFISSSVI